MDVKVCFKFIFTVKDTSKLFITVDESPSEGVTPIRSRESRTARRGLIGGPPDRGAPWVWQWHLGGSLGGWGGGLLPQ